MIRYTPEQADVLDYVTEKDGIVLVSAGAGTGKSFMAEQIARTIQPKSALYTAFNKAIVTEGQTRFSGLPVSSKTLHALAYAALKPKGKISDITYSGITEKLTYGQKAAIIKGINDFFVSSSTDMFLFFEEYFPADEQLVLRKLCVEYIMKMVNEEIPPSFNYMLKYLHLQMAEGTVNLDYDFVMLDEINDTTAVSLEIFKLINAPKKIGLGETHQAIYDFLNLVDGFEELKDESELFKLTQSFRCSEEIASGIEKMWHKNVDKENFRFAGTDEPVKNGKTLYVTRTNAEIIFKIMDMLQGHCGFTLLRDVKEIFAYPMAIANAQRGAEVYHPQYKFLETEYKNWQEIKNKPGQKGFLSYLVEHVNDRETQSAVNLLMRISKRNISIFKLYKDALTHKKDPSYTISTVFTSKGLEFETVYVADDLNSTISAIQENGGMRSFEDLVAFRCYYVAASRAGTNLRNAVHI